MIHFIRDSWLRFFILYGSSVQIEPHVFETFHHAKFCPDFLIDEKFYFHVPPEIGPQLTVDCSEAAEKSGLPVVVTNERPEAGKRVAMLQDKNQWIERFLSDPKNRLELVRDRSAVAISNRLKRAYRKA